MQTEFKDIIPNFKTWTTQEILESDFPEPKFLIEGVVPEGLTMIAGSPKVGKSWLALDIAQSLSVGADIFGGIHTEKMRVLYLSLEDTPRRLKSRLIKQGAIPTGDCHILTQWASNSESFLWLHKWMSDYPDTGLIIIDTLAKFIKIKDNNSYTDTVEAVGIIKNFAEDYNISVILITHLKKGETEDFMQGFIGSTGLTASVDNGLGIIKKRGEVDAVLKATGRDIEEVELALKFDTSVCRWVLVGNSHEVAESRARQEIIDLLKKSGVSMTPKEISTQLCKNESTTKGLLLKMVNADQILKTDRGKYSSLRLGGTNGEILHLKFQGEH